MERGTLIGCLPGIEPATQICALVQKLNLRPFSAQAGTVATKPCQPGLLLIFLAGLKISLAINSVFLTYHLRIFVKITTLAASLSQHKQVPELPKYWACLGGKNITEHVHLKQTNKKNSAVGDGVTLLSSVHFNKSNSCFVY